MADRETSATDRVVLGVDRILRLLCGAAPPAGRPSPAEGREEGPLSEDERRCAAALMRVDHAGEVAAQALYQGQALAARGSEVRARVEHAAEEENDHLAWCRRRIAELGGRPSLLNPAWYAGALAIGALAGAAGDRWSLGFIVETEQQVVRHLARHLEALPAQDVKSRAILAQMKEDEARHATTALHAGAAPLPDPIKGLMALASRVMTGTAYWI